MDRGETERKSPDVAAVETIATGGGLTLGGLATADLYAKAKGALSAEDDDSNSSSDSKD